MPNLPRLRLIPLAAVILALAVVYLYLVEQRPAEVSPREPDALAPAAPAAVAVPPARAADSADAAGLPEPPDAAPLEITGRVADATGAPLDDIPIELQPHADQSASAIAQARSDRHGEFRFDAVTPGRSYRLRVAPTDEYAGHVVESLEFDAATPRLEITLERIALVDAEGIVVDTNGAPVANFTLRLRSASANLPERAITSDASGYFRLEQFPAGEVEISTSGRDFYRIGGLALDADRYNNLTLVVDRGDYQLTGQVVDEAGAPVVDARVTLKGVLRHQGSHSFSYRSTLTNEDGGFVFGDLGSYRYTLGIHAAGYETQMLDHEFQSFAERLEIRLQPLPAN